MDFSNFNYKKYDLKFFLNPKNLFLRNFGLKQIVFKNTFWLALSQGSTTILKFFLFVYVARILGATEYGKFNFALSFVGLFVIFSSLGIFKIVTREFAKDQKKESEFPAIISLKIILSLIVFVFIFIGSFFITDDLAIRKIMLILGLYVLSENFLVFFNAFFQARQKMEYQAMIEIFQTVLITGLGFLALFLAPSAKNLSWVYFFSTFVCLAFVFSLFHFKIFPLKFSLKLPIWKEYLVMSYPLVLATILGTVNSNIDSTIMGSFKEITATGWYGAAQKIVQASLIPMSLIGISSYPILSKFYFQKTKENFYRAMSFYIKIIFFLAAPIAVGGVTLAPKIIYFVFGAGYSPAIPAFQILILAFAVSALAAPFSYSLIVANQQKKIFWLALFSVAVNIVSNIILIPKISLYGASFANLITFVLSLLLTVKLALKYAGIKICDFSLAKNAVISIFSAILMYLAVIQPKIYHFHIIWLILTGISVYFLSFLAFKMIEKCVIKKI